MIPTDATLLVPDRIETSRLVLRTWRPADRPAFAALNADPEVVQHLGIGPMSRAESDTLADRIEEGWRTRGYGLYAVERRAEGDMVGFIGVSHHRAIPSEVEIGWRLARSAWGRGLATEGALAVRDMAYATLGLPALISITIAANTRSLRVMEKLGLVRWRELPFEGLQLILYRGTPEDLEDGTRHTPSNGPTGAG